MMPMREERARAQRAKAKPILRLVQMEIEKRQIGQGQCLLAFELSA